MQTRRGYLRSVGGGAVACLASVAGCVTTADAAFDPLAPTDLDESAATQFRLGLHNRGYVDASIPRRIQIDWSMPVNRGEHTAAKSTPVAVDDGEIVVAGDTGEVHRMNRAGELRWTTSIEPTTRGIHGTPAVANGTVYVGAYDGAMYAFDVETGERRWRTGVGDAIGSSPVYFNGICYIAVEYAKPSGSVVALDAGTGDLRWIDRRPTDHPHSTVALDRDTGRLVVGANDGVCYAWSFPDMERAWTFETDGPIKGPVAIHGDLVVFGSWDEHVYGLALEDGSEVWSFAAGADVMSGPAVDPEGTVYVGSHDSNLYALDGATGEEQWRFETGGWVIGSVTATREHVLAGAYDDRMYAIEAATGRETWHVEGRGNATSAVLVDDGALYYAERASEEDPGHLYRLVAV